jgi:hypothetical protein
MVKARTLPDISDDEVCLLKIRRWATELRRRGNEIGRRADALVRVLDLFQQHRNTKLGPPLWETVVMASASLNESVQKSIAGGENAH